MKHACILAVIVVSLAASCGGNQGTQPDDMSAREHRRAAAEEQSEAEAHDARYEPGARTTVGSSLPPNSDLFYGTEVYNPTDGHRHARDRHRELTDEHREAAATLEAFEESECARFPAETRAVCPLLGQLEAVEDVEGGVQLQFGESVRGDAVADHMRCHLAHARTHGREGMEHCPLYVEGASVTSDGVSVTLRTDAGAEAASELARRARAHVAR